MSSKDTKTKIILSSIRLFNAKGIANVRLQQIANHTGISVGNLAYHFRNKDAIVHAVCEYVLDYSEELLGASKEAPTFKDFDEYIAVLFQLVKSFPLIFFDLMELNRNYNSAIGKHRENVRKIIGRIFSFLEYNKSKGLLKAEYSMETYLHFSKVLWTLTSFWVQQRSFRERKVDDLIAFKSMIWETIYPFVSEEGAVFIQEVYPERIEQH